MDLQLRSNQAIIVLTFLASAVGLVLALVAGRSWWLPVAAGGATFLSWATSRELDPDRDATGQVAGILGGIWALLGGPVALLPLGCLLLAARLVSETTGRRPLIGDLVFVVILATVTSSTRVGWVAGFTLAIAIYIDDRMHNEHDRHFLYAAMATAVMTTVVAALLDVFPEETPDLNRPLLIGLGVLAMIAATREPPEPTTLCDSRRRMTFLRADRIHASRSLIALSMLGAALAAGGDAAGLVPAVFALALSLASSELERIIRRPLL